MTQKTVQKWMLGDGRYIEDSDGELGVYDEFGDYSPYLRRFLFYSGCNCYREIAIEIVNTDMDLEKYRNSLINQAKSLVENRSGIFTYVLDDAFKEDHVCKYLYTHEHVSRNISKKVWNDVRYKQSYRINSFIDMIEDGIISHMIRELKNVKSNRDLPAFYESIQTFIREKFMEKHGRARLQKALRKIINEEFKGHKQMADRQKPGPKGDDGTLGGVEE